MSDYDPQAELDAVINESAVDIDDLDAAVTAVFEDRAPTIVVPEAIEDPDEDLPPAAIDPAPASIDEPSDAELASQWREYNEWLKANPEVANYLGQVAATGQIPQTAPAQTYEPAPQPAPDPSPTLTADDLGLDMDDPVHRNLWGLIQGQNALIGQMGERLEHTESALTSRQQQEYQALTNRAVASYQTQRSLTEAEVVELRSIASNLEVLPSLLKGVDPVTGAPIPVDPLTAVERALDIAYWSTPKFRDREFARQVTDRSKDVKRKQKAGSLAGSSGSMPKGEAPVVAKNGQEMRQLVGAALSEYMIDPTE